MGPAGGGLAWVVRPTTTSSQAPSLLMTGLYSSDTGVSAHLSSLCTFRAPLGGPQCGVNQNPPLKTPKQGHQLLGLSPQLLQASPPEKTLALLRNTCIEVGGSLPDEDRVLFLKFFTKKSALLVQHCYSKAHSFPLDQLLKTPVPPG